MIAPIVTADQLAAFTKGKILASDPRVSDALNGATLAVRRYCGWHITPDTSETVTLDGPGGQELELPSRHVTAVANITARGVPVDPSTYTWSPLGQVRLSCGWWPCDYQTISLDLTHGFDEAPDVAQIILAAVARELSSPTGATVEQAGTVSAHWATIAPGVSGGLALLGPELAILDTYRLVGA